MAHEDIAGDLKEPTAAQAADIEQRIMNKLRGAREDARLLDALQSLDLPDGRAWVLRRSTGGRGFVIQTMDRGAAVQHGFVADEDLRSALRAGLAQIEGRMAQIGSGT